MPPRAQPLLLFDAAVLGKRTASGSGFTSIARVAKRHIAALAGSGEWRPVLCSSESVADLPVAALEAAPFLEPAGPVRMSHGRAFLSVVGGVRRLVARSPREVVAGGLAGASPRPPGILRRIARAAVSGPAARARAIPRSLLREARVFHSPLLLFPEAVLSHPRIARVLTVHDIFGLSHPELCCADHERWDRERLAGVRPSDVVIAVSEWTRGEVLARHPVLPAERVVVAPLAAGPAFHPCGDPDAIRTVKERYAIPPDEPYLLMLAQYDLRKNFDGIVRAFAEVVRQEKVPGLRLVLAGSFKSGTLESAGIASLPGAAALRGRIHVTGWIDEEDLSPLYSGAEAFLFPSFAEGFGLPPLEAMACGTPVVASNVTAVPEVVGDAGILVTPGDDDALAQAILAVVSSSSARADLSRRGLLRAARFSWETFGNRTLEAYRLAAEGAPSR
jgi:glycosyltransferase involved in cell wall biosynthesis